MAAEPEPRRRRGSIRVRTTVAATAVVGLALVIAGVAMTALLGSSLRDDVLDAAFTRAEGIALGLRSGAGPEVVAGDPEDEFVQVVAADGTVDVSSTNVEGDDALVTLSAGGSTTLEDVPFAPARFLVVATGATTPEGERTILVGRTLEDVSDATGAVTASLVIGIPVLVLLVALVTWWVVGRTLAPVDAIRGEVDAISTTELHRRVSDPGGDDEIARLAATMNRMLGRLEQGQARERRFVSDASHELRSPIASIRQQVEVAIAHPERSQPAEVAEAVLAEDLRLQELVEDLLLLSRADETAGPRNAEPVDLDDLVLEEAGRLRGGGRDVDLAGVSAGRVLGEREALRRMVRNLAENAGRHARARIAFGVHTEGGTVVLTTDDDGPGIAAADRQRVFERFVRLDDARERDAGGSGLGLSIVAEVVRIHGGSVAALQAPLGGARIEVRLPELPD